MQQHPPRCTMHACRQADGRATVMESSLCQAHLNVTTASARKCTCSVTRSKGTSTQSGRARTQQQGVQKQNGKNSGRNLYARPTKVVSTVQLP
eukprot:COSAG01_NODE_19913_length_982_cov_1.383918_1_plen_93_part_00